MSIEHIVHVWLDVENAILPVSRQSFMRDVRSPAWSRRRMDLFSRLTLASLLNQTDRNFRVFLFCNPRFRKIHDEYDLPPIVEKIYDDGRDQYSNRITADHVHIFRTDSDDLLRFDCMEKMKATIRCRNDRTCRVIHKVIQWNMYHRFISDFVLPRSPFCSHVFPRSIYSNWDLFRKQQFMDYKTCPNTVDERLICIVRHGKNVTFPRKNWDMRAKWYLQREMKKRNNVIRDPQKIANVLSYFGLKVKYK